MPQIPLLNSATVTGLYDLLETSLTSNIVTTEIVTGLTITKTADKESWVDGVLTYTITITNEAGLSFTDLTVTDLLDTTLIDLVADSVTVDGTAAAYTYTAGLLSVVIPDIASGETAVITFQVSQI